MNPAGNAPTNPAGTPIAANGIMPGPMGLAWGVGPAAGRRPTLGKEVTTGPRTGLPAAAAAAGLLPAAGSPGGC